MLRDALCFVRFLFEQMSARALNTCAKIMNVGREPRQTLLIQALVDIHQRKSLKLNMTRVEIPLKNRSRYERFERFFSKI